MGALTSSSSNSNHHKREYPFPFQHPKNPYAISNSIPPDCFHTSKKPKLSSPSSFHQIPFQQPSSVSNSSVARISRYPETSTRSRRELHVHAPCRALKFGLSKPRTSDIFQRDCQASFASGDEMWNFLSKKLDHSRRVAVGALSYSVKQKEIIDLEPETSRDGKRGKEVVSDDSSVEEVVSDDSSVEEVVGVSDDESIDHNEVKILEGRSSVVTSDGDGNAMEVENLGKMVESLGVDRAVGVFDVEVYKKLVEAKGRKRTNKLKQLGFEIEFLEKKKSALTLLRPVKKPEEKPVEVIPAETFMPLTNDEVAEVKRALSPNFWRKVLVSHKDSSIDISGEILQCLGPGAWLNDEVINLYLALLKEREKREPHKFVKCHFFNTFFYKKLASGGNGAYDYKAVRRWTTERKLGYFLIDCDKIFIPVHHREMHWCLAIINKKDQKFQYLDSLKGRDFRVLEYLAKYYVDEVKDKSGRDIDVSDWEHEFVEDLPEQQNGYDCGVFMIKYADFYSRGLQLCFSQEHMRYFRVRTAKEILKLRAN